MNLRSACAWGLFTWVFSHASAAWSQQVRPARQDGTLLVHRGMCEPSGGVALPRTGPAEHFLVASDEDNTLQVYAAGIDGAPVTALDLGGFLGLDVARDDNDKSDIEAAAWLGDRVYWIGSHSRSGEGRVRPQRRQFFATTAQPGTAAAKPVVALVPAARSRSLMDALATPRPPRLDLRDAIGKDDRRDPSLAPEASGLNIEGLAARPDGKSLWVALRNPLRGGRALLVPFENPQAIVEGREEPRLGEPVFLDLNGRGVRDIAYSAARGGYVVMGGPTGDAAPSAVDGRPKFRLYAWDGKADGRANPLIATDETLRRLEQVRFQPEIVIVDPSGARVHLISDDGDLLLADGKRCKKHGRDAQQFRSTVLTLE